MTRAAHRFSRLTGAWRIGDAFFARAGVASAAPAPRGLVDRVEALVAPGVGVARVPDAVRPFFEDPASLDLYVRSRWRWPFRPAWRVMRRVMGAIGQLHLPLDTARVRTRMVALDGAREGRGDARGVVRSYADTGAVFQVFAYGVTTVGAAPLMSVAIPLPLGHLTTRYASLRLPLEETLRFWSAASPDAPVAPRERAWPDATFLAVHEQRLFGVLVVEHTYVFCPL